MRPVIQCKLPMIARLDFEFLVSSFQPLHVQLRLVNDGYVIIRITRGLKSYHVRLKIVL